MNLNLIAYGIYILLSVYIIVVIGNICYRNGNIYVLSLIPGHKELCLRINSILLVGYYLVNIGYSLTTIISWEKVATLPQLIETIAVKTAIIVAGLCALHYTNIVVLTRYAKKLIQ